MPDDPALESALKAVKVAQQDFERDTAAAREARRKVFREARHAGLDLRSIGEAAGLHHTRVSEIIRGK